MEGVGREEGNVKVNHKVGKKSEQWLVLGVEID